MAVSNPSPLTAAVKPELIWLGNAIVAPLEALLHALAGAIASDLGDPTVIVTLGGATEALKWTGGRFQGFGAVLNPLTVTEMDLENLLLPDTRGRVFIINPAAPLDPPPRLATVNFDRIVYVTHEMPEEFPAIRNRLRSDVLLGGEPHFSSFIASVLRPAVRARATGLLGLLARLFDTAPFEPYPTEETTVGRRQRRTPPPPRSKIFRDSCVLGLDAVAVLQEWNNWQLAGGTTLAMPFVDWLKGNQPGSYASSSRWGRAVTNRRVGVALSGGGACAYRIGPVLWMMEAKDIPVDVYAGLSGGALVGAYYCHGGPDGLNTAASRGPLFMFGLPLVSVSTWPFEAVLDWEFDGTRVEELEVRFAAVTTVLPPEDRPFSGIVGKGTLGEAVRASGTLPPMFGPTIKDEIRYTDGGAASIVPAQVVRNCGADVVLSCNAIPGPERGNPFSAYLLGRLLHRAPIVGRLIDAWAWRAVQWWRGGQQFGIDADVFLEFDSQQLPMLESVLFILSWDIIGRARADPTVEPAVDAFWDVWNTTGRPPPPPPPPPPLPG